MNDVSKDGASRQPRKVCRSSDAATAGVKGEKKGNQIEWKWNAKPTRNHFKKRAKHSLFIDIEKSILLSVY